MAWDKTKIAEGVLAPDLNDEIRANWDALETALNKEHNFSTGGTASLQGILKQGSARCFFQDTAPATRADGSAFASTDLGMFWIDTNSSPDNQLNILTATTPTWTPVSTEIIAALLAGARTFAAAVTFSVAVVLSKAPTLTEGIVANNSYLQARNAADDGNVDLIKADGSDVPTVPDGTSNATNAAPTAGSAELANAKYVDDQIAAAILVDVNGTPITVYTKYFTGTLDADSATTVVHSIASGATKILAVNGSAYNDAGPGWHAPSVYGNIAASGFNVNFDDTNVYFKEVGANFQGNAYKLRIDYIL